MYLVVPPIVALDHHPQVAVAVPDQVLLLAALRVALEVLLEVPETEEGNEAEAKVLMLRADMTIKKKRGKRKENGRETGTEIEIGKRIKRRVVIL